MNQIFLATYFILWTLLAVLLVLVLLLYRHFGRALLPPAERMQLAGLDIGSQAPDLKVIERDTGNQVALASTTQMDQLQLLLFGSSTCPICGYLWEAIGNAITPPARLTWVGDDFTRTGRPVGWRVVASPRRTAHADFLVPALPYGYVLGSQRTVMAKGLINSWDDASALVERAFASSRSQTYHENAYHEE